MHTAWDGEVETFIKLLKRPFLGPEEMCDITEKIIIYRTESRSFLDGCLLLCIVRMNQVEGI